MLIVNLDKACKPLIYRLFIGAAERTRTVDLLITNQLASVVFIDLMKPCGRFWDSPFVLWRRD
jgi:hypothetical protein